jgi:acetate---CoA ligase (ADP-forming)
MASFDDYFGPKSIAIVGASDDPQRIGGRPLAHMIRQEFEGAVYPVNARRDTVQGLRSYPSLLDIGSDLDFVLIAVPARDVPAVIRQAISKNAKTALIFSAGFAEAGPGGAALQAELTGLSRSSGLRIIGPNCLGVFNTAKRFYPTFSATIDRAEPRAGGAAIASQSGAYGSHIYIVSHMRGLGIGYWATTGNEADLHVAELINLLAERDDVHTIMAYAESIKDGDLFVDALETARQNRKPVIMMKAGRSPAGAEAARAHTASLTGEDAVYDAIFRQHGAYRARTTEEMLDIAYACRPRIYPAGKRLGIVTISGGAGILISDAAASHGLEVPPMPEEAQAHLKALLPFASPRNPVDVTAQFFNDLTLIPRFARVMLDEGGFDGLIGFWTSVAGSPVLGVPLLEHLRETMAHFPGSLFLHSVVANDEMRRQYEDAGFPCFEDPSRAVAAMAALMFFGAEFAKERPVAPALPAAVPIPPGPISEYAAKRILAAAGLPVAQGILASNPEASRDAARTFGGRVAMKISSPDILHKTDMGGVILGVEGAEAAGEAFERLMESAKRNVPGARIEGVLVSPMAEDGVECILGAKIDPVFGPVVLFGLGGIYAEVLNDVSIRRAPFDEQTALSMIAELKGAKLLTGARGKPPADLDALARAISRFSLFAAANAATLDSVEMNPLRAWPQGCAALDALVTTRENAAAAPSGA